MAKKILSVLLVLVMVLSLAACGGEKPAENNTSDVNNTTEENNTTPEENDTPDEPSEKVYYGYYTADHTTLNFLDNVDSPCGTLCQFCMSYLYRAYPDDNGITFHYIADLASDLPKQMDEEGLVWQIPLRQGATWEDGTEINADTWMFTFQQELNPEYAYRMATYLADNAVCVKNAMAYYQNEGGLSFEDVGLKKVDDYTLELTLEKPASQNSVCEHFFQRSNTPVLPKLWDECMGEAGTTSYGSDIDHFISCGPYTLTKWDYDDIQIYTKRADHWLTDLFHYDRVEYRIVPTMNARVELWEQGLIDMLSLDAKTLDTYYDDPRIAEAGSVDIYHIDINCKNPNNPICGSVNYRKAIYHAVDRETIGSSIYHLEPAGWYISNQAGLLSDSHLLYRDSEWGNAIEEEIAGWSAEGHTTGYNPELALDYFNKACEECGVTATAENPISIIAAFDESSDEERAMFEFLQSEFAKIFEGRLKIEFYVYGGISATAMKQQGDDVWDLSPNDWGRSLSRYYPFMCFYYFLSSYSGSPNNYFSDEFDAQYALINENYATWTYEQQLEETAKLEQIYLDTVIQVPTVQEVSYELHADNLILPTTSWVPGFGWGACYGDKE